MVQVLKKQKQTVESEEINNKPVDEKVLERLSVAKEDVEPMTLLDEGRQANLCLKTGNLPGVDDIPIELSNQL